MDKLLLAGLFSFIPLLSWVLTYYFANKQKQLHLYKNHWVTYYDDFLFIVFNFFAVLSITNINQTIVLIVVCLSAIFSFFAHRMWFLNYDKEKETQFMYSTKKKKVMPAGYVHFIFTVFEMGVAFSFLIFSQLGVYFYLAIALIFIFFIFGLIGSRKIHGHIARSDWIFYAICILIILAKIIISIRN
ncbi:Uncharacterised protein [uncultured archaeon]|nr:Uncharacterised protein [uncultured archaeon]